MKKTPSQYAETDPTPSRRAMLFALNYSGKHIYQGTVATGAIARRRAKNKAARAARRAVRR